MHLYFFSSLCVILPSACEDEIELCDQLSHLCEEPSMMETCARTCKLCQSENELGLCPFGEQFRGRSVHLKKKKEERIIQMCLRRRGREGGGGGGGGALGPTFYSYGGKFMKLQLYVVCVIYTYKIQYFLSSIYRSKGCYGNDILFRFNLEWFICVTLLYPLHMIVENKLRLNFISLVYSIHRYTVCH